MNNCTRCNGTGCEPTTPLDQALTASPCERCKGAGQADDWMTKAAIDGLKQMESLDGLVAEANFPRRWRNQQ